MTITHALLGGFYLPSLSLSLPPLRSIPAAHPFSPLIQPPVNPSLLHLKLRPIV